MPTKPELTDALAAYIGEVRSGTVLHDSANGIHGSLSATGAYSLISGHAERYALDLTGTQIGQVPTTTGNLEYALPFSVSAWLNPSFSGLQGVCGNRFGSTGFQLRLNGADLQVLNYSATLASVTLSGSQVAAGWHPVAMTATASEVKVYWDSTEVLDASTHLITPTSGATEPMGLYCVETSSSGISFTSQFADYGADLIFWDKELSQDEIDWLGNSNNSYLAASAVNGFFLLSASS